MGQLRHRGKHGAGRGPVRYTEMLRTPWRIRAIRAMLRAAAWLARPSLRGHKILEHYEINIEINIEIDTGKGPVEFRSLKRGALLVRHHEVFTYKDAETAELDRLLSNAEATFLGAEDQERFR